MPVDNVRPTRYPELGYAKVGSDWRIVATDGNAAVGPFYKSKAELLADLDRYASDYGCEVRKFKSDDTQLMSLVNHTNGMLVLGRYKGAIYIRLPIAIQKACDGCSCDYCKAHPEETPAWDTLVVGIPGESDPTNTGKHASPTVTHTWTCHMPDVAAFFRIAEMERRKK